MKKDMTTFEMAQAAFENPGKVFVGRCDLHSERLVVKWGAGNAIRDCASGATFNIEVFQTQGYIWNEKVEPLRGSYEFVTQMGSGGAILAEISFGDAVRIAATGALNNYDAVANKRFKVTVNVEEIV